MKAYVRGLGWVTAAGMGCGRDQGFFSMTRGTLPVLTRKTLFSEPDLRFGRLDRFSRLGLAGITFALRDAGLESWREKRPVGVICSTVRGCLEADVEYFDTVINDGGALASPNLFAYTLPNSFLGEAAIRFGLTGPTLVMNTGSSAGLAGLERALGILATGGKGCMLAGMCDLDASPPLPDEPEILPGSLFLVVDNDESLERHRYAELNRNRGGALCCNGTVVDRYDRLVEICVQGMGASR